MQEWTQSELRFLRSLKNPQGIQRYLETLPYHLEDTAWSPRLVMKNKKAHCLEAAFFAAAALRVNGYKPYILDLEAVRDTDHVIAVYKKNKAWGSLAASNFASCRSRAPVYKTLRELALSYFEGYFNMRGERSLRTFSKPIDLSRFDKKNWTVSEKPLWYIVDYLFTLPHTKLLTSAMEKSLVRVDARSFKAYTYGYLKKK